jgi:NAD(P)H-dependent flavin oxidoreductase YrpB (nitropropane dioxygenase family)
VGQIVGRMNAVRPTKEVIREMVNEYVDTMTKMTEALNAAAEG